MAYALLRGDLHEEGKAPRPRRSSNRQTITEDRTGEWKGTAAGRDWLASLDGVS